MDRRSETSKRVLEMIRGESLLTSAEIQDRLPDLDPRHVLKAIQNLSQSLKIANDGGRPALWRVVESRLVDIDRSQQITAHSKAIGSKPGRSSISELPVWVPPKWEPSRAGAMDHAAVQSRGLK